MTAIGYPTVNVGQFHMGTEDARNSTDAWVVGSSGKAAWQLLNRTRGKVRPQRVLACFRLACLGRLVQVREVHRVRISGCALEQTVSGCGERSGRGLSYRPAILVADPL